MEQTFKNLDIKIDDYVIAQIADSTNLNPCIPRLTKIHHIACRNHALNCACEDMDENDPVLE